MLYRRMWPASGAMSVSAVGVARVARSSSFPGTSRRQPSTTMQALTFSFPSSTRSHNGVQLDSIIFYSGPASMETRETTPIDADEWPDVGVIFVVRTGRLSSSKGGGRTAMGVIGSYI